MYQSNNNPSSFWTWFTANEANIRKSILNPATRQQTYNKVCEELSKFSDMIYPEFNLNTGDPYHMIITADGELEAIEDVEAIVDAAPVLKHWKIVTLRQAVDNFVTSANGNTIEAKNIRLWRRYNYEDRVADVRLFIKNYHEDLDSALFLCLNHSIGEDLVIGAIDHIEYADIKEMSPEFHAISLIELREEIEATLF